MREDGTSTAVMERMEPDPSAKDEAQLQPPVREAAREADSETECEDAAPQPKRSPAAATAHILFGGLLQGFMLLCISIAARTFGGLLLTMASGSGRGACLASGLAGVLIFAAGSLWVGYRHPENTFMRTLLAFGGVLALDRYYFADSPLSSFLSASFTGDPFNYLLATATVLAFVCGIAMLGAQAAQGDGPGVRAWWREELNEFRESIGLPPK